MREERDAETFKDQRGPLTRRSPYNGFSITRKYALQQVYP